MSGNGEIIAVGEASTASALAGLEPVRKNAPLAAVAARTA
jgi:uncharacterized protein YegP (UPF0339 family)